MLNRSQMLHSVNNVPVIGYTFALQLKSDMYSRDAVIAAAESRNLPTSEFPEPTKRNSFKNALRKQQRLNKDSEKVLHYVEETETAVVFQVDRKVLEHVAVWGEDNEGKNSHIETRSASYEREMLVVFDKTTDRVVCDNSEVLAAVYKLLGVFQESYTKQTLTRYVLNLLEKNTSFVPYIKGTGVYFVPSHQKAFLENIIEFLFELDGSSNTVLCEIPDLPNAVEAVQKTTVEKFADMRQTLKSEIEALCQENQQLTKKMLDNRLESIGKQSRMVEEYEVLLNRELREASSSIENCKRFLKNYHLHGTLENPLQEQINALPEESKKALREELPEEVAELLEF